MEYEPKKTTIKRANSMSLKKIYRRNLSLKCIKNYHIRF